MRKKKNVSNFNSLNSIIKFGKQLNISNDIKDGNRKNANNFFNGAY